MDKLLAMLCVAKKEREREKWSKNRSRTAFYNMFGCRRGPGWVDANEGRPKLGGDPFWGIADLASRHSTEWAALRRRELSCRHPRLQWHFIGLNWIHLTVEMSGYSDTPLIVTLLVVPKGVTLSEEVSTNNVVFVWSRQHPINIRVKTLQSYGRKEGSFWHRIKKSVVCDECLTRASVWRKHHFLNLTC